MEENLEESMDIYCQDGVLLTSAPAAYISYLNTVGTLFIEEYLNSNKTRCIEWKPNDITIESDMPDQEWAVVNTVERRSRTFSENYNRSKYLKVNLNEIKSFRVSRNKQRLTFMDGKGETLCMFVFQQGNCELLVATLKGILKTALARRDKHLHIILDHSQNTETQQLNKSFAELNLFQDPSDYVWGFVRNFHNKPYETAMEAFAKITDIGNCFLESFPFLHALGLVYRGPEHRIMDDEVHDILNRSLEAIENTTTTHTQDAFEVIAHIPKLPNRKDYPRGRPLSIEQWNALKDSEGRVEDVESVKLVIFRGGVSPDIRKEVWKYLLDYYVWDNTNIQRQSLVKQRTDEYNVMKLQWTSMSIIQEDNFSDYRERKSLIEKDVKRTDRTIDYFEGDDNPNLQALYDILMTYVMYNFDLGYVQGMSDLLSPILYLLDNEIDAFWCFVGFMNKVSSNFDMDQAGMKEQLQHLHMLLSFVEPKLANYLKKHESSNMFFCFRWLLVWFKREFSMEDVMLLWEVLWTGLPCQNFHLLICIAILETEKDILMENNYGFCDILKHINDLSGNLDVPMIISKAEGMYHQIIEADHLTDPIKMIIGLPVVGTTFMIDSKEASPDISDLASSSHGGDGDESIYERGISASFL